MDAERAVREKDFLTQIILDSEKGERRKRGHTVSSAPAARVGLPTDQSRTSQVC